AVREQKHHHEPYAGDDDRVAHPTPQPELERERGCDRECQQAPRRRVGDHPGPPVRGGPERTEADIAPGCPPLCAGGRTTIAQPVGRCGSTLICPSCSSTIHRAI